MRPFIFLIFSVLLAPAARVWQFCCLAYVYSLIVHLAALLSAFLTLLPSYKLVVIFSCATRSAL